MTTAAAQRKNGKTALIMLLIVAAMVGLAFASSPLYRAFCEATGFDGTTQRADKAPGAVRRPDHRPLRCEYRSPACRGASSPCRTR